MVRAGIIALLATTAVAGIASTTRAQLQSAPPAEQCARGVQDFDLRTRGTTPDVTAEKDGTIRLRSELERLRDAARVFAANGREDACRMVLEEMRAMWARNSTSEPHRTADANRHSGDAGLRPVTSFERPILAETVIGTELRNLQDRRLGEVEDVIIGADARVAYALVGVGGFLEFGDEYVAVPWDLLRTNALQTELRVDVPESRFQDAPRTSRWPNLFDVNWQAQVDLFWNNLAAKATETKHDK